MADKTYQIDFELSDGTIKSVQFTVPGQIQSDWNQSDETAVDYIKNRPFSKVGDGLSISSDGKLSADTKSLGMTGTTVGQIAKIKAVDENGKPTEWEAAAQPLEASGGWASDQISLLEVILNNIAYIDTTTGQTAADRLIASLRGSGTEPTDDISQSGSVLTIRALANNPTQSGSTLSIT